MTPMRFPRFAPSVQVVKVAFGRFQMALTMGRAPEDGQAPSFLFHTMLFAKEHKDRLDAQAARLQALLDAGENPADLFNMAFWYAPEDKPKLTLFQPKKA